MIKVIRINKFFFVNNNNKNMLYHLIKKKIRWYIFADFGPVALPLSDHFGHMLGWFKLVKWANVHRILSEREKNREKKGMIHFSMRSE